MRGGGEGGGGGDGAEAGNTGLGHLGECVCPYVAIRADSETSRRRHSGIGGDQELHRRRKETRERKKVWRPVGEDSW